VLPAARFLPGQTRNGAATAVAVIAHFSTGTFFEERPLMRHLGEAYLGYRRRVPRFQPLPRPLRRYISRERMDLSANARTERGTIPRTRTAAAETHRAREKAVRGGRGTGISPCAGSMYM
jgi:hypothetical protein